MKSPHDRTSAETRFLEWLQGPDIDCGIETIISRFIGQESSQKREWFLFYGIILKIVENKFLEVFNETKG